MELSSTSPKVPKVSLVPRIARSTARVRPLTSLMFHCLALPTRIMARDSGLCYRPFQALSGPRVGGLGIKGPTDASQLCDHSLAPGAKFESTEVVTRAAYCCLAQRDFRSVSSVRR